MSHRSKRSVRMLRCKECGNPRYALEGERMPSCPYDAQHQNKVIEANDE